MKQVCTVEELGEFWTLSADGYAGFEELYRRGDIKEVACLAHIRRKFFDIHATNGSGIAKEALERIAALYQIEASIRGKLPDVRRSVRQEHAAPLIDDLEAWLHAQLMQISGKSALAGAIRYGLTRLKRLRHRSTPHESILRVCHRSELVQRFLR